MLRVIFGYRPQQEVRLLEKAQELETVMQKSEIRAHFSDNIIRDALQKFAFVSPAAAAGAYFNATSEKFQVDGQERELFIGLIKEVEALGNAMGITFTVNLVETGLKIMDALKAGSTMSMQRGVGKGIPCSCALVSAGCGLGREKFVRGSKFVTKKRGEFF